MRNAGRRAVHGAMWTVAVFGLLVGIFVLLVHPRVFGTNTYMDVNSGDIRMETTFCGLRIWNYVRKTPFSREVRRLGIPIVDDPIWRLARTEEALVMGTHSHGRLDRVRYDLELLTRMFAHGDLPDQERLVILEGLLESLKKQKLGGEISDRIKALEDNVYGPD